MRHLLSRRGGSCRLGAGELVTVLVGLAELNAYNRELFAAALKTLAAVGAAESLNPTQRHQLVAALRSVAHGAGDAFVETLARRERQDRYEAAADQVWQRKLAGMYGETRDLQGAPEDTERALLRNSRLRVAKF